MLSLGRRILVRRIPLAKREGAAYATYPRITKGFRHFSAAGKDDEKHTEGDANKSKESLEETVRRMQDEGKGAGSSDDIDPRLDGFLRSATSTWSTFTEEVGKTWGELLASGERKDINKKLRHPEDTVEGDAPYTGSVEIMVIDESENLTAWDRMKKRLTEAPIITGKADVLAQHRKKAMVLECNSHIIFLRYFESIGRGLREIRRQEGETASR